MTSVLLVTLVFVVRRKCASIYNLNIQARKYKLKNVHEKLFNFFQNLNASSGSQTKIFDKAMLECYNKRRASTQKVRNFCRIEYLGSAKNSISTFFYRQMFDLQSDEIGKGKCLLFCAN